MNRAYIAILQCFLGTGALLATSHAMAGGCPAGSYYVTSEDDPSRTYSMTPGTNAMLFSEDPSTNCTGSIGWQVTGTSTSIADILTPASFDYLGAGDYTFSGSSTYTATARIDGSLTAFYDSFFFVAQRNVAPRLITISNQEARAMTNAQLQIDTDINSAHHFDWEGVGDFTQRYGLGAVMANGTWDGSQYTGDFLYTEFTSSSGSQKQAVIGKLDGRQLTNVRISVWFMIGGQWFTDYEDVGTWDDSSTANRSLALNTSGVTATWDGSEWTGDFLH